VQIPLGVTELTGVLTPNSFDQKSNAMKTTRSKKLNTQINTICDFNLSYPKNAVGDTDNTTGTDPTNTTIITLTTISSHHLLKS
jgi:hypothetical protein